MKLFLLYKETWSADVWHTSRTYCVFWWKNIYRDTIQKSKISVCTVTLRYFIISYRNRQVYYSPLREKDLSNLCFICIIRNLNGMSGREPYVDDFIHGSKDKCFLFAINNLFWKWLAVYIHGQVLVNRYIDLCHITRFQHKKFKYSKGVVKD